jgi:hypothetical protein
MFQIFKYMTSVMPTSFTLCIELLNKQSTMPGYFEYGAGSASERIRDDYSSGDYLFMNTFHVVYKHLSSNRE